MMKVTSKGRYNTSHGLAFVIDYSGLIKVNQEIMIDGEIYRVKRIIMQTTPSDTDLITVFV